MSDSVSLENLNTVTKDWCFIYLILCSCLFKIFLNILIHFKSMRNKYFQSYFSYFSNVKYIYLFPDLWMEELIKYLHPCKSIHWRAVLSHVLTMTSRTVRGCYQMRAGDRAERSSTGLMVTPMVCWQPVNSTRMNNQGYNFQLCCEHPAFAFWSCLILFSPAHLLPHFFLQKWQVFFLLST